MSERTPESWIVEKIDVEERTYVFVNSTDGAGVADVGWLDASNLTRAHLIAAAPDMFAALTERLSVSSLETDFAEDLMSLARALKEQGCYITALDLVKKARQIREAIAKATGTASPSIPETIGDDEFEDEEEEDEEQRQEYILIVPGAPPSGDESLHTMYPSSADMCNYLLAERDDPRRWLPSVDILGGPDEHPLTDPMHQLAHLDGRDTPLGKQMVAAHEAGECGWGCPVCSQVAQEAQDAHYEEYQEACPEAEPIRQVYHDLSAFERYEAEEEARHIIDHYETDVTMKQVKGWDDFDLQEWLDAWAED